MRLVRPLFVWTNVMICSAPAKGLVTLSRWEMWARVAVICRNKSAVSLEPATILSWCELEPVRLSELISRHPVQMFLIQLIHSLRVTFNSVKVCHCFSPQTQHPVTVSKNKIFILMLGNIFSFKLYYCESSLNHIIDPFLEVCQDVQRKISSLLTSVLFGDGSTWHWCQASILQEQSGETDTTHSLPPALTGLDTGKHKLE